MRPVTAVVQLLVGFSLVLSVAAQEAAPAQLEVVRQQCGAELVTCQDFDAVVFVHGIYGGTDTFKNPDTGFDWPKEFPNVVKDRRIDVFRLTYRTALLSWASGSNPDFEAVAQAVFKAMTPLRKRQYRSIGFVAHSLGGNVVSTYIHMVKTQLGDPQRSQHAFVITLATPVLGAQIADLAGELKTLLNMKDPLLNSLQQGNLYLTMLNEFRLLEVQRELRYVCRPVHLHAAYEEKYLGGLLIVTPQSAAASIANLANSPIVGFARNHSTIAKPANSQDVVYQWVQARVEDEYMRIATWDYDHRMLPPSLRLCEKVGFIPEN